MKIKKTKAVETPKKKILEYYYMTPEETDA